VELPAAEVLPCFPAGEQEAHRRLSAFMSGPILDYAAGRNRLDLDGTSVLSPYFRIFNPVLQGRKFDPLGNYVRRWIPELARVPAEYIHRPWEMPDEIQRRHGCVIGRDYPAPIVDRAMARSRAPAAYRQSLCRNAPSL
jgi:deoxyribodipyrimidine photolyase